MKTLWINFPTWNVKRLLKLNTALCLAGRHGEDWKETVIYFMKIISKKICMWSDKGIKVSHSINICVSCLSRSEWATKSCWMKLSHFVWWSDDIAPPWWHARWRSGGICILLKYFHSLKYFSGVENISPWQSWYKWLCYLCPTVRDIGCWYICCFLFKALIDLSASSVLLKRNICGKQ